MLDALPVYPPSEHEIAEKLTGFLESTTGDSSCERDNVAKKVRYRGQGFSRSAPCPEGSGGDCYRLPLFVQGLYLVVKETGNAVPVAHIGK